MSGFNLRYAEVDANPMICSLDPRPDEFMVTFWGVRGNIPTPGLENARYGGNTACVEVRVAGHRLIFDGGTGLRVLGKRLRPKMPLSAYLFFTHTHWDRIQGFPFFMPAFIEGNSFHIYGATGPNGASIKQRLCDQMLRPNFPVPLQVMQANLHFHDVRPGAIISLEGDVTVETMSLNRPNGALGYRITWDGHSVVYATDTEHELGDPDPSLLYLANEADLLIYDAFYTDHSYYTEEEPEKRPATWKKGIELAIAANVKRVILFHHDPEHDDVFLDQVEADIQTQFPNVRLAQEGMVVSLVQAPETASVSN